MQNRACWLSAHGGCLYCTKHSQCKPEKAPYQFSQVCYDTADRGVVLEALGQFEDALTDYRAVLAVQPQDPAGWNNLGNASAGLGRWQDAKEFYGKAASLAPEFAFSVANKAVAMFQLGETNESMREMR